MTDDVRRPDTDEARRAFLARAGKVAAAAPAAALLLRASEVSAQLREPSSVTFGDLTGIRGG